MSTTLICSKEVNLVMESRRFQFNIQCFGTILEFSRHDLNSLNFGSDMSLFVILMILVYLVLGSEVYKPSNFIIKTYNIAECIESNI